MRGRASEKPVRAHAGSTPRSRSEWQAEGDGAAGRASLVVDAPASRLVASTAPSMKSRMPSLLSQAARGSGGLDSADSQIYKAIYLHKLMNDDRVSPPAPLRRPHLPPARAAGAPGGAARAAAAG